MESDAPWDAIAAGKLRLNWKQDETEELACDFVWSSFKTPKNGEKTYRLL